MPRKYENKQTIKTRLCYGLAIILLIMVGLCSRKIGSIPSETGDALWAMTLFCFIRVLFPTIGLNVVAIVSLAGSFAVEFSQLIRWEWLVEFRSTTIGHLLLGQGFLWADLFAYVLGVALILLVARTIESKRLSDKSM